jgi:hypothetical protein
MAGLVSFGLEGYNPSEVLDKKVGSLIPAEPKQSTENSHCDWYSERGHFISRHRPMGRDTGQVLKRTGWFSS